MLNRRGEQHPFLFCRYRATVIRNLPQLQKLDNVIVQPDEVADAMRRGVELIHPYDQDESIPYTNYAPPPAGPPQTYQQVLLTDAYFMSQWASFESVCAIPKVICPAVFKSNTPFIKMTSSTAQLWVSSSVLNMESQDFFFVLTLEKMCLEIDEVTIFCMSDRNQVRTWPSHHSKNSVIHHHDTTFILKEKLVLEHFLGFGISHSKDIHCWWKL